jgi:tryptophanyl-tRNA synthetase
VKRWCAELAQKSGPREEHFFCVVDLHAITLPQNPAALRHTRILAGFSP